MKKESAKKETEKFVCPLCGFIFDSDKNPACPSCPMRKKCQVVCCPNCKYQTVVKAEFTDFLTRLFFKERGKNGGI